MGSQNYVSIALCNVAAASHCETQLLPAREDESAATGAPDEAPMEKGNLGAQGGDTVQGSRQRQNSAGSTNTNSKRSLKDHESDHNSSSRSHESCVSDVSKSPGHESSVSVGDGDGPDAGVGVGVASGVGDQYWLMTTDILRDVIDGCLASATADVKNNLIKAMNNLMVSNERRAALVVGHEMSSLFALVHGYTPEVNKKQLLLVNMCTRPLPAGRRPDTQITM